MTLTRTIAPSIPTVDPDGRSFVYLHMDGGTPTLTYRSETHTGASVGAALSRLWGRGAGTLPRVLVANRAALAGIHADARLSTIISILESLSASSLLIDLTTALARLYPHEDTHTLNQWVSLLHLANNLPHSTKNETTYAAMRVIYHHCTTGTWTDEQHKLVSRLEKDEQALITTRDPYKQFASATMLADSWTAIAYSDPVGREAFMDDGTVVRGVVTEVGTYGAVTLTSPKPMKIRSGKRVVILSNHVGYPSGHVRDAYLVRTTINTDGTYALTIRANKGRLTAKVGDTFDMMEAPFLVPTFVRTSKWSRRTPHPPETRHLPPEWGNVVEKNQR